MPKQSKLEQFFDLQLRSRVASGRFPEYSAEYRFHPVRKWRFDFAWPKLKIAVEIDGGTWASGRHTRGGGYEKDCEKLNAAALLGWFVFRFTGAMVDDGRALTTIENAIAPF